MEFLFIREQIRIQVAKYFEIRSLYVYRAHPHVPSLTTPPPSPHNRVQNKPAEATGSPDTTTDEPHPNSNTQQSKNNTANVVVQQHSRKLLKMVILMPETC